MKSLKWNSPWFISIVAAVAVLALNWAVIFLYWYSPFVQGWDGQGIASAGQYYAAHIFPSFWGWTQAWLAGMPFPQFYPPLFFFVLAAVSKLLPFFSYDFLFKTFVTLMEISVPAVLVLFVSKRTRNPWSLWITAIMSVLLASSYFPIMGNTGVSSEATFNVGMVTQLFGFLLVVGWLHFFLKIETDKPARYWAGLFLFLTFLANGHDDIAVFIIFMTVFIVSSVMLLRRLRDKPTKEKLAVFGKNFLLYFLSGLVPLLATAFWSLPLLYNYTFLTSLSVTWLPPIQYFLEDTSVVWVLPIVFFIVAIRSGKNKTATEKKDIVSLSLSILAIIIFMYIPSLFVNLSLPSHVERWFGVASFLLPIIIGLSYVELADLLRATTRSRRVVLFVIFVLILFLSMGSYSFLSVGGYYIDYSQDNFSGIESYFAAHPGLAGITMTESAETNYSPAMFVFDSIIGPFTGASVFDLRESSINSVFMTPIRNSLSINEEDWGFETYLSADDAFLGQSVIKDIDRAKFMGIQSFLVRSKLVKDELAQDGRLTLQQDFGNWQLWSFKQTVPRAVVPALQPIPFYGQLNFKARGIAGYDWARVQEELLFADATTTTFMYPPDQYLDTSPQLSMSSTTFISEYVYHDANKAYERLSTYAENNNLYIVASQDPLFARLYGLYETSSTTERYHITILDKLSPSILNPNPLDSQFPSVFAKIAATDPSVTSTIYPVSLTFGDHDIQVQMSGTSSVAVPVIVKGSYFPAWKNENGEPSYLASPGFILTYATSSFDMEFTTPDYVYVGWFISIMVVLASIGVFWSIHPRLRHRCLQADQGQQGIQR